MKYAIPNFDYRKYSYLAGATFTVFFATAVLFTGILADNMSRKLLLCISAVLWSLTSIGTSFCNTYWQLCIMRILLGLFEACIGPPAYSLITDFFPPEKRTLANSVYSFGIYIGACLANLTIMLIEHMGWRATYFMVGCIGIGIGLLGFIIIIEP
jgi:MFS family permease